MSDCFHSTGTKSRILGPKNDNDSALSYTGFTLHFSKVSFLRRLFVGTCFGYKCFRNPKFLETINPKLRWILDISVGKTCKFLWCSETKMSLFSSYWNVDVLSWHVILRALSCIEFILLLKCLLWNIQINLQQLTWKVTKDLMIILRFCILLQEASLARVFNFWLVVLQILLIWFSKVRLETMHGFTISFPFCGLRGFY